MSPGHTDLAIEQNFQRIENASEAVPDVVSGRLSVIGASIINTRLSRVDNVVACISNTPPVAGACFVIAYPYSLSGQPPNQVVIGVYSNTFVASTISIPIEWIATGEMILG